MKKQVKLECKGCGRRSIIICSESELDDELAWRGPGCPYCEGRWDIEVSDFDGDTEVLIAWVKEVA